jgi:hypothetical protein
MAPRVRATLERERGQVKPRRPALRPLQERLHVPGIQLEAQRLAQKRGGLLLAKAELVHPDLDHLAACPKSSEG